MQHIEYGAAWLAAYHAHLQRDHDYRVWADVLDLSERLVSTVDILDGQVNVSVNNDSGPDRTGTVVLSDPEGALSYGTAYAEDDHGVLWVNRLVRLRHSTVVPSLGQVDTTCLVGVPTSANRSGAELSLELGDKSLLADHGVRPRSFGKGANVGDVLRTILGDLTGEQHMRIPPTSARLSVPYTTGMGDDVLTPWRLAKSIAGRECGWRLYYSADGYATAEPTNTARPDVQVEAVLALPDASTSFTEFKNYSKATSRREITTAATKTRKSSSYTIIYEGVAVLPPSDRLSETALARNGVPRTLPIVTSDDNLVNQDQVNARAVSELQAASGVDSEPGYEVMPFFHLDQGDYLNLPLGIGRVPFDAASIPLGVGGNMTLGTVKWVSAPVKVRATGRRTIIRPKKKGGKK